MTRWRILLRRTRTLLWTALTLLTILAALMVGIGELLMPYTERYQPRLEAWLSREFGRPVRVGEITGEWIAPGPRFTLRDVSFQPDGAGEPEVAIQHAALDLRPLHLLVPGRPFYTFRIIGADLVLEHLPDGRWQLSGLGVGGGPRDEGRRSGLGGLLNVGEVYLQDSSLQVRDVQRSVDLSFGAVNGRLQLDGDALSAEVSARLRDREEREQGDLQGVLLLTLGDEQRLAEARWHLKGREVMLDALSGRVPHHALLPERGRVNAEVWGAWAAQQPVRLEGVVDLRAVDLALQGGSWHATHANSRFAWHYAGRGDWRLDLDSLAVDAPGQRWRTGQLTVQRDLENDLGLWLSADTVPLDPPVRIAQTLMASYDTAWPRALPRSGQGEARALDVVLDRRWKVRHGEAELRDGRFSDWERWPDVDGLDGRLVLARGHGQLQVHGKDVAFTWPGTLRRVVHFDVPECGLGFRWGSGWQVRIDGCALENQDLAARAEGLMSGNTGRPVVDLNLRLERAAVGRLGDYWPERLVPERAVDWLRRGLLDGQVDGARVSLVGDLDDWPFDAGSGQFEAVVPLQGVRMDYQPGWPVASGIEGIARFRNSGMSIRGSVADLGGASVATVAADVPDLREPWLDLEWQAAGPLARMTDFVAATPLRERVGTDIARFRFEGPARTVGYLRVPLKQGLGEFSVDGTLWLGGNAFTDEPTGVRLDEMAGALQYDREGFNGPGLTGQWRGHPVTLDLRAGAAANGVFQAVLHGHLPARELLQAHVPGAAAWADALSGTSHWRIGLDVRRPSQDAASETWLTATSDLVGTELDLPAPLRKMAHTPRRLQIAVPLVAEAAVLDVSLAGVGMLRVDMPDGLQRPARGSLRLGTGTAALPEPGQLAVSGATSSLNLDGWMRLARERLDGQSGVGRLDIADASLDVQRLVFLNRMYRDVAVRLDIVDGVLQGTFDSEALAGTVRYSPGSGAGRGQAGPQDGDDVHRLVAEFERLQVPQPLSEGVSLDTDPRQMPALHLYARDFSWRGLELGEMRVESWPTPDGLHFETVEAGSPDLTFRASGDWEHRGGAPRSSFEMLVTSESLGRLLTALDISSVIQGGQTVVQLDAWWPGAPTAFSPAHLNGEMQLSILQGELMNAQPGAGRVLGLISVAALPRRLALDFRDVFSSGFQFDETSGTLRFDDGDAHTDALTMQSTAATITISGMTDMEQQVFDYEVSVQPGLGQTLPVLGALAGGPGGAAAGLALQGLLQKQLGEAAEARYRLTGPWQDPVVEPVLEPGSNGGGRGE